MNQNTRRRACGVTAVLVAALAAPLATTTGAVAAGGTVTGTKTLGATDIPCGGSVPVTVTLDAQTGIAGNPVDITGGEPPKTYQNTVKLGLEDDRIDALILGYWHTIVTPPMVFAELTARVVAEAREKGIEKPVVASLAGEVAALHVEGLDASGTLVANGSDAPIEELPVGGTLTGSLLHFTLLHVSVETGIVPVFHKVSSRLVHGGFLPSVCTQCRPDSWACRRRMSAPIRR